MGDVQVPISSFCPQCGAALAPGAAFCMQCGKQLKEKLLSTSGFTQAGIYVLSVLLPPLGLWPGIKYVRQSDPKAKQIGWVAIILTVVSTVVTLWLTFAFLNVYLNTITQSFGGMQLQ